MADITRDRDNAFIYNALHDSDSAANEVVLLKLQTGETPGNPAYGIARSFTYTVKRSRAVITGMTPQDIMYSNGVYQTGDVQIQLLQELKGEDQGQPGDRIIWRGHEYRIFGKVHPSAIGQAYQVFSYVIRKVGKI